MIERELKAVVPDPEVVRSRLAAMGAEAGFTGLMADRRYDRNGELAARDQVLRVRTYRSVVDGTVRAQLCWKGPVRIEQGYKLRPEHELATPDGAEAEAFVAALGYRPVHAIDRFVEYRRLGEAVLRLEWYPRMDVLLEVEGPAEAIERAVAATGMARGAFGPDALAAYVERYEARTGSAAAVSLGELAPGERPSWER